MNTYGDKFRISIFGESHGDMIGVVLDGVPAGIPLVREDFLPDLDRRRSGSKGTTPRKESDRPTIVSGVFAGCTTGAPIAIVFSNINTRSEDYSQFRDTPRPGHADFTAQVKHNFFNDLRGGGHFSGRLTLCLVAAGVVAKKMMPSVDIKSSILEIGGAKPISANSYSDTDDPSKENLPENWKDMIKNIMAEEDSLGGIVECVCSGLPIGLGEPFFESVESKIAHLIFSIPATRGIEFGDGFGAASMKGSQHNDCFINKDGGLEKNGAGGINGGITNGNPIVFRVAIKPTSSISKVQKTYNFITEQIEDVRIKGRHDACITLRAPVVIEAAAAIALVNLIDASHQI